MADIIKLHAAQTDASTARYDSILTSTIASETGYTSIDMRCLGAFKEEVAEGDSIEYIDGEVRGSLYMRDKFSIRLIPFSYRASEWDLTDWAAIKAKIRTAQFVFGILGKIPPLILIAVLIRIVHLLRPHALC